MNDYGCNDHFKASLVLTSVPFPSPLQVLEQSAMEGSCLKATKKGEHEHNCLVFQSRQIPVLGLTHCSRCCLYTLLRPFGSPTPNICFQFQYTGRTAWASCPGVFWTCGTCFSQHRAGRKCRSIPVRSRWVNTSASSPVSGTFLCVPFSDTSQQD